MATERQKKVLKKLSENVSQGQAMREAGYSEEYSKQPSRMKAAKSFQELINEVMPDDEVAKIHDEILHKRTEYVIDGKIVKGDQPHPDAKSAVDMRYKLSGSYEAERLVVENQIKEMTEAELDEEIAKMMKKKQRELESGGAKKTGGSKGGKGKKKKAGAV